jgi:hypothetical protein
MQKGCSVISLEERIEALIDLAAKEIESSADACRLVNTMRLYMIDPREDDIKYIRKGIESCFNFSREKDNLTKACTSVVAATAYALLASIYTREDFGYWENIVLFWSGEIRRLKC